VRTLEVGDDIDTLGRALRDALHDAQLIVTTGGLGPTADDITRDAIAATLNEPMAPDPKLVATLRERFAALRRPMPESNLRQALLIPSAAAIPNANGTAPGWWVERDGCVVVAMPGPPGEMNPMWDTYVLPRVERLLPGVVAMRALMTFGVGESAAEEKIQPLYAEFPDVRFATYAKTYGVQIHMTARAPTQELADWRASDAERSVRQRLGDDVYGSGEETLADVVGRILRDRRETVAAMESVTGGMIASLITDVEGSSDYFAGGIVAYTREAKARYGVDETTMDHNGLISAETAGAMALAARRQFNTAAGVATTGIAGMTPVEGRPPGTAYVAVAYGESVQVRAIHRSGRRATVKHFIAQSGLDLLRRALQESNQ